MIPKSVTRFSDKIMRKQEQGFLIRPPWRVPDDWRRGFAGALFGLIRRLRRILRRAATDYCCARRR